MKKFKGFFIVLFLSVTLLYAEEKATKEKTASHHLYLGPDFTFPKKGKPSIGPWVGYDYLKPNFFYFGAEGSFLFAGDPFVRNNLEARIGYTVPKLNNNTITLSTFVGFGYSEFWAIFDITQQFNYCTFGFRAQKQVDWLILVAMLKQCIY